MTCILVTGAAGFIGRALCPELARRGHRVIAGLRRSLTEETPPAMGIEARLIGDILPRRDWIGEMAGADVVVHLAQRAHRRSREDAFADEPEAAAWLARGAARAGARRLVYVSSIKAMAEATPLGQPLRAGDPARPADAYGQAKLATERALTRAAGETGLELVILRPPLVYGPGVAGNFRALLRLAGSGLPLPFAAVANRRSLIARDNLIDLIAGMAEHRAAPGRVWLGSDGADLSTPALIQALARGQGRPARLFPLPDLAFTVLRAFPAVGVPVASLTLSLQVDDAATRGALGWRPPVSAEEALLQTARAFAVAPRRRTESARRRSSKG